MKPPSITPPVRIALLTALVVLAWNPAPAVGGEMEPIRYLNPGLEVDLGVGLWAIPLPMDYDRDGDMDLLVSTTNKASPGLYFFENTQGKVKMPVFEAGVRVGDAKSNITISYGADEPRVLTPGAWHPEFRSASFNNARPIDFKPKFYAGRAVQWKFRDYDGDGLDDLIIGASDWRDYGWDDAFDAQGHWTRGPLHGHVYFIRNIGAEAAPRYAEARAIEAGGKQIDVYGCPSANFADWDGDGDLDLICGEFLDRISYFENVGARTRPRYAPARRLHHDGKPIAMELQMIQVVAVDWDRDGDEDLVIGQEDGRVAFLECVGEVIEGVPDFLPPRFFRQKADRVKTGALTTPSSADWDGDGDEDLICGDTAGFLSFVENLDGGNPPIWAAPRRLEADGKVIHVQAGPNGSIQGPAEAKWGYTVPRVADWDGDGRFDIVLNSILGSVTWHRNIGTKTDPALAAAQPIEVRWPGATPKPEWNWWTPKGNQLVTQWRTTPFVIDLNRDGLMDLVMLDREGYLAFFERRRAEGELELLAPRRIFRGENGEPLRLNSGHAGKSGRRKFVLADWDGDGKLDLLLDGKNIDFYQNIGDQGEFRFKNIGAVSDRVLAGHTTSPTIVDWNGDGIPELLVGAEDGFLYYFAREHRSGEP